VLSPQLKGLQAEGRRHGEVKGVELLGRTEAGGQRTYRYRVMAANGVRLMKMSLAGDGKVAGLWIEVE
jgi:hypothetical protein